MERIVFKRIFWDQINNNFYVDDLTIDTLDIDCYDNNDSKECVSLSLQRTKKLIKKRKIPSIIYETLICDSKIDTLATISYFPSAHEIIKLQL